MYLGEIDHILDIGLPFALMGDNRSSLNIQSKVAGDLLNMGLMNPSDMSEVHVGALLTTLGVRPVFVERAQGKTPDIECVCANGDLLDVEVVRAQQLHDHKALRSRLNDFASSLRPSDVAWHIGCFFADATDLEDLGRAFDAAASLKPGEAAGVEGRWAVVAVSTEATIEFVSAYRSYLPRWWPSDEPTFQSNSVLLGGPASSSIVLSSLIPLSRYIGPIRRKAERPQGRVGRALLIAMDATQLPRAHARLKPELEGYFPLWDQVSGILIFDPRFWAGAERKSYVWSIHPNPHARIPLPDEFSRLCGEVHTSDFHLSSP